MFTLIPHLSPPTVHTHLTVTLHRGRMLAGFILLATLALFAGPSVAHDYKAGDLTIDHPWSRATPPGAEVAAGYMVVRNGGAEPDRLVAVTSAISDKSEIHSMRVDDKGVMTMRPVEGGLEIPAGGEVELKPGGFHLMFLGLKQRPVQGDRFPATLTFEKAGEVAVEFAVDAPAGGTQHDMDAMHDDENGMDHENH